MFKFEPSKCAKFDHAGLARKTLRERMEGIVQIENVYAIGRGDCYRRVEGHFGGVATAFLAAASTRVIDENPSHTNRRNSEKLLAIHPRWGGLVECDILISALLIEDTEQRLVHESGWLQCVSVGLFGEICSSHCT